ncbi:proton channel OtopLc-like isoform X2 [Hyposmocoma kahamanoa]|uniref:proton channel OtopLc-like isoform X2 n=1 Tax=Hyposmocoma kahamanoa TaxID=1477025 RepID=UPI000E6D9096|nr:proton channel OtopLc-like isoform X2 [Hyposmocoma kahamanoa]
MSSQVHNTTISNAIHSDEHLVMRRTMSQPGPVSGGLVTATAARAARKRATRSVNYAADLDMSDSDRVPRLVIQKAGDDSGTATPTGDRNSPFPSIYNSNYRNGDLKSLNGYRLYPPPNGTPRKRSEVTMDAQSLRSVETHAPPPTDPQVNKKLTGKYVTEIAGSMYATILVTLGLIVHVGDTFVDAPVAAIYSIVLASIGLLYHIYLIIDISRYKSLALKNQKIRQDHEAKMADFYRKHEEEFGITAPGDRTPSEVYKLPPGLPPPQLIKLKHDYCFSHGRHSGSFYLKLGAAGFAFGNLVHAVLLITAQLGFIFDDNIENEYCVEYVQVAMDFFNPIYCFVQLFFVFKYSNVIILKHQGIACIAFMHIIGSSLCFWISAIVRETILALTMYAQSIYGKQDENFHELNNYTSLEPKVGGFINIGDLYDENCVGSSAITAIVESFSPYLYPFSVEFNILIVAVYYIIWSNIGHCNNEEPSGNSETQASVDDSYSICKIPTANEDNDYTSNIVIHADCHASNKGLFLGLIIMVVIMGMLIIGFVFSSVGGEFLELGYLLNDATKLALHTVMLFAVILAFAQIIKLDINEHSISLLDDILLFVCLPPFVMEAVFSLIATLTILNVVKSIDFCIMVVQVLIQTPLIMDALRRCSNTRKLRQSKPGREVIMLLIITNVAMWVFYTFSYKSPDSLDERYTFYGKVVWTILGHVSLPLIMFYRFHSSVCFADIWDSAYKPGSEH